MARCVCPHLFTKVTYQNTEAYINLELNKQIAQTSPSPISHLPSSFYWVGSLWSPPGFGLPHFCRPGLHSRFRSAHNCGEACCGPHPSSYLSPKTRSIVRSRPRYLLPSSCSTSSSTYLHLPSCRSEPSSSIPECWTTWVSLRWSGIQGVLIFMLSLTSIWHHLASAAYQLSDLHTTLQIKRVEPLSNEPRLPEILGLIWWPIQDPWS